MKKIFLFFSLFSTATLVAQTIKVLNKSTLEALPSTLILLDDSTHIAANEKGVFELSDTKNSKKLILKHVGYASITIDRETIEKKNIVLLDEISYEVNEVVISASKFEEKISDVPQQVKIVHQNDIVFQNQTTTADVLQQSGYVNVQKSQMGGGSPVMRGFEANKILMVIDGVRMNNAIYRGGHLQNSITVDNNLLEKTEMVFGAGSVLYGSDALGGVIHYYTQNPTLSTGSKPLVKGGAVSRYSSAMNEKMFNAKISIGGKKIGSLSSLTMSDFGDLNTGTNRNPVYGDWGKRIEYVSRMNGKDSITKNSDVNKLIGTAYKQLDFMQKIIFQTSKACKHSLNFQLSTSSNIPRYDRLSDTRNGKLRFADWYYGPQKRNMLSYQFEYKNDSFLLFNEMRLTIANQEIEESRFQRSFNSIWLQSRIENVNVKSVNFDFAKELGKNEIRYGVDYFYNTVNSKAHQKDIHVDTIKKLDTRYPDGGSSFRSMAAYISHTYEFSSKFLLTEGIRYSNYVLKSKFMDKTFFPFPFSDITQKASALNGNIGLVYKPNNDWKISTVLSSGFRSPNVDDMTKVFESAKGNLIVPNKDLKPEYTYNAELGIGKRFDKKVYLEVIAWHTWYKDAITLQESTFNGAASVMYDGKMSKISTPKNAQNAFLQGISSSLQADISPSFAITQSINYTYGRIKTDSIDYPLDHVQPIFGKTSFVLKQKKFKGEFYVLFNGAKNPKDYNLQGEDNQQYSLDPVSGYTPAWQTFNIKAMYSFTGFIHLQVGIENVLDTHYRVFASGISAAGRNVVTSLRVTF